MKYLLKQTLLTTLCTTFLSYCDGGSGLPFGLPAQANTISSSVRRVSISEATGQSGASPPTIELSPGYGVNISFIPTGEIVEKVWLDNPSFVSLDVDGCLIGLGSAGSRSQSGEKQCQQKGAKVLHLRRINPVNFPGLPKTNSTLLTAVTNSSSGQRLYLFRVTQGSSKPQYHTLEIVPNSRADGNTSYGSSVYSNSDLQVFNRGLTVAVSRGLVHQGQPLYKRIQNFLRLVQAGKEIELAASTSGISIDLVRRLGELGRAVQGRGDAESGGRGNRSQTGIDTPPDFKRLNFRFRRGFIPVELPAPDTGFETPQTLRVTASPRPRVIFGDSAPNSVSAPATIPNLSEVSTRKLQA